MSAPSLEAAIVASTKPRWLRHISATPSPSPTPSSRSAWASELERASISPKVSSPSSSTRPTWSGARTASDVKPPAGPGPHSLSVFASWASFFGE